MNESVLLSHGSGGKQSSELVKKLFARAFGMNSHLTDSALLPVQGAKLAFTTDSFVIDPIFFPGGNIGKLAVCGTVNDLAVSGAIPAFISASFIIEEGFPLKDLETIVHSMAEEAAFAGVRIVTGDTKVVEKGKCDRIFINTSGIGILPAENEHISSGRRVSEGDSLIMNGQPGNHSLAILGARKTLSFATTLQSDCASLNHTIAKILRDCHEVHFMRDLTRGGLAAVLNELSSMISIGIRVDESAIPLDEQVRGICEILGFDPLYLANEGKFLIVSSPDDAPKIMEILRNDPNGMHAAIIGVITGSRVVLDTIAGGKRIIDMPSGTLLPRIC